MTEEIQNSDEKKDAKIESGSAVFKNRNVWILVFAGLLLNLGGAFLLWWQIKPTESSVILHYNAFFGIDVIDFDLKSRYYELFAASAGGLFIWLVNSFLSFILFGQAGKFAKDKRKQESSERILGGYLLLASGIVVQLGILIYVLAIIRVNT